MSPQGCAWEHAREDLKQQVAAQPGASAGDDKVDVIYERCCGLDVHKRTVVACLLTPEGRDAIPPDETKPDQEPGELDSLLLWDLRTHEVRAALPGLGPSFLPANRQPRLGPSPEVR